MSTPRLVFATLILLFACAAGAMGSVYKGQTFTYTQPDGGSFLVQLSGDQDYADEETLEGWRIVKDPATHFWCYARLSAEGKQFISTGMVVGAGDPASLGLGKHLRLDPNERRRLHRAHQQSRGCDARGRPILARAGAAAPAGDLVFAPPSRETVGIHRGLTLLVQFPDRPGDVKISPAEVEAFCNQESDYGSYGSARQYFYEMSGGRLTYTNLVTPYTTAGQNRAYYTDESISGGTRAQALAREALNALEAANFDFRSMDLDHDGYIDAINLYYAGEVVNAWSKGLWPGAGGLTWTSAKTGVSSSHFQLCATSTTLQMGVFCHENGHMLCGFPDIYDYDAVTSGGASSGGAGDFCLMNNAPWDKPNVVSGYLRYKAGWGTATTLTNSINTRISLTAQNGNLMANQFLIYPKSSTEYFLVENRWKNGRDADRPTGGIAIWHIDEQGDHNNQSYAHNTTHANYECALIQADNLRGHERNLGSNARNLYYLGNAAASYAGAFNDNSDPSGYDNNAHWWDGSSSGLRLSNFSAQGNTVSLVVGSGALVVTAPNGGQALVGGGTTTVSWTSYGTVGAVTVAVSTNAGSTWQNLVTGTPNDGSQAVTLPNLTSASCLMRVSQTSGAAISDNSDAVFAITAPPAITTQPQSKSIASGTTTSLSVTATGGGLSYQWYQGARGITTTPMAGATTTSFTTPALTVSTNYWVKVSNVAGSVNSNAAMVTVVLPPVITTQPQSLTIASGTSATLTVSASGDLLNYQWCQGDSSVTTTPIAGATTASFITPPLLATTSYWVQVSNPGGSVASTTATVSLIVAAAESSDDDSGKCGLGSLISGVLAALLVMVRQRLRE